MPSLLDFVVIASINQLRKRATLRKLESEANHRLHDARVSRSLHRPKSIDVIIFPSGFLYKFVIVGSVKLLKLTVLLMSLNCV